MPWIVLAIVTPLIVSMIIVIPAVPFDRQPFPDSQEYAEGANNLVHGLGYTTTAQDQPTHPRGYNPPRYPPGYSLILAPFALVGRYPDNVQFGAKAVTALLVLVCAWAALDLGGPWAAVWVVLLVGLSPFVVFSAKMVLSDALGAALAVVLLPLIRRGRRRSIYVAGLLAGFGVVVRLSAIVVLGGLLIAVTGRDRVRALLAAIPPIAGLGIYQWITFGAPWRTGYDYWLPGLQSFGLSYVVRSGGPGDGALFPDLLQGSLVRWSCKPCGTDAVMHSLPPVLFYPLILLGALWVFSPPFIGLLGGTVAVINRSSPIGRLVIAVTLGHVGFFVAHFYTGARFMAPAALMLTGLAGVAIPRIVKQVAVGGRNPWMLESANP